jgi:hypothetical protein
MLHLHFQVGVGVANATEELGIVETCAHKFKLYLSTWLSK